MKENLGHRAQHGSYAHFPGTGPAGTKCFSCEHMDKEGEKHWCLKWRQLMRAKKGQKPIAASTASCKYYEGVPKLTGWRRGFVLREL